MVAGLCILELLVAVYFAWLYWKARRGGLRRNRRTGLRTRSIMASDRTWNHIHRKYSWTFLAAAILMAAMGADLAVSCILTRDASRFDPACLTVLWVLMAALLAMVIMTTLKANSDAAEYNRQQ